MLFLAILSYSVASLLRPCSRVSTLSPFRDVDVMQSLRQSEARSVRAIRQMAKCPICNYNVRTPCFLNLDAWAHLECSHCKSRLEMRPPRSGPFAPIMGPLFVLAREGRVFEFIAYAFSTAIIFFLLFETIRPEVRLRRKALPKPEIRLNINEPSNQNSK